MNRRISLVVVAIMIVLIGTGSAWTGLTDGLVAHWAFDETSGTIAKDSAGDNNGMLVNGPVWASGYVVGALDFDGVNDYVGVADDISLDITNAISVCAWVILDNNVNNRAIFGKVRSGAGYSGGGYHLVFNEGSSYSDGTFRLVFNKANGVAGSGGGNYGHNTNWDRVVSEKNNWAIGRWYHVVATWDGTTNSDSMKIYVDGYLNATHTANQATIKTNSSGLQIGRTYYTQPRDQFDGSIDDVCIYNRALSAEEIQQLYQAAFRNLAWLEIVGPDEVAEDSQAEYTAIAYYDNDSTADVTGLANWSVEPNDIADVNAGVLTTEMIDVPRDVTITAAYSEGDVNELAEKDVSIFAICPSGYALEFDGSNDYVTISDAPELNPKKITLAAWIYPEDLSHNFQIIGKWAVGTAVAEYIFDNKINNDALRLGASFGGTFDDIHSNDAVLTANIWQHVAVTWDGSMGIFYVNGKNVGEDSHTSGDLQVLDNDVQIGYALSAGGPRPFDGMIDEVAIYDRALSAEEIQMLMHTRPESEEPNLVGYWDFDEGEGQVAYDMSGNGNVGQLGSDPNVDSSDPNWMDSIPPVGICSVEGIVERNLSDVLNSKLSILEQLYETIAQEEALWEYMDIVFKNRDFGNTSKGDVVKAKQKIMGAIQQEEQAETAVDQSVDKLGDALTVLDIELDGDGETQE